MEAERQFTFEALPCDLVNGILQKIGPAAAHGVHWFYSHPPIADLAFEMDVRGIRQELRI